MNQHERSKVLCALGAVLLAWSFTAVWNVLSVHRRQAMELVVHSGRYRHSSVLLDWYNTGLELGEPDKEGQEDSITPKSNPMKSNDLTSRNIEIIKDNIFLYMHKILEIDGMLLFEVFPEFMMEAPQPKSMDEALDLLARARHAHELFTLPISEIIYGDSTHSM